MNHLRRTFPVIVVLISVCAFADSVSFSNLNANFTIQPNLGDGGNVFGTIFGPGVNVGEFGGFGGNWFDGPDHPLAPGSVWSGGSGATVMFPETIMAMIGSQSYSSPSVEGGQFTLFTSSFTLPTNGQNFTINLPASLSTTTLFISCATTDCPTFTLATNPGLLTMSFHFDPFTNGGVYDFAGGSFTTVPEPGTVGLMAIGFGTLTWLGYKRSWASRSKA